MQTYSLHINELFSQMSQNNESALWQLHEKFFPRIFRFVLALTGNKETTEEIVNDTFLDLWQKRHLLSNVTNPDVYIFICAKNRAIKQLKKENNYIRALENFHDVPCSITLTPHDMLVSSEILRRINLAIQSLPPQCKLIFSLVKENNLKYREVAVLLGLSQKTIENQMTLALKKLSQSIPLTLIS
ncbi:MAG: sigma-70 family RNA polymerase sigma factor [Agriterribacter sp.]